MELEKPLEPSVIPTEPELESTEQAPELSPVLIIPRVTFNYVVIAITFLLVGFGMGTLLANRAAQNTRSIVSEAVAAALCASIAAATASLTSWRAPCAERFASSVPTTMPTNKNVTAITA